MESILIGVLIAVVIVMLVFGLRKNPDNDEPYSVRRNGGE